MTPLLAVTLRFAMLCWYCALVANGLGWWALPLLVPALTGRGCRVKPPSGG